MASSLTTRLQNLILPSQKWSMQLQIVRHKGGIKPHRKLRHLPRAPSKMFKLAPINHIPDQEINQILRLKYAHHEKMSALTQFLWEDYLINSDVGEAAKAKAQIEEAEHQKLLKLNEETNKQDSTHGVIFKQTVFSKTWHNSPIYGECQTQSAWVLALP